MDIPAETPPTHVRNRLLELWLEAHMLAYRAVCSGSTGHAEAVQLTYQKGSVGYGELVEFFYRTHDPTTLNAQGPDRGTRMSI